MNALARPPAGAGLCARCRLARVVTTRRGSSFVLCELSKTDLRFARYPQLPIRRCDGFEDGGGSRPPAGPGA